MGEKSCEIDFDQKMEIEFIILRKLIFRSLFKFLRGGEIRISILKYAFTGLIEVERLNRFL